MNDFTREELEDLYAAMRIIDNLAYDLPSNKDAYRLKEKIESMIDNYCEHPINNVCMECLSATCEICNKIYGLKDE